MNVIYKLTKKVSKENPKYYIGSKKECKLVNIDGELAMIDRRGKAYYSSCNQERFKNDLKRYGFTVEILEEVTNKKKIYDREKFYIDKSNAVCSDEYYNLADPVYCPDITYINSDMLMANEFETNNEHNINCRVGSRRDNKAKALGYKNFAEMYLDILRLYTKHGSFRNVDRCFGTNKYCERIARELYSPLPFFVDNTYLRSEITKYLVKGVSLKKSCEILSLDLTVGRFLVGDLLHERNPLILKNNSITRDDIENRIFDQYLEQDVYSAKELATKFHTSTSTIGRIIHKIAKERLRTNESK